MAARLIASSWRTRRGEGARATVMAVVVTAIAVAGCVPDNRAAAPGNDDPAVIGPALPTSQTSPSPQIAATAALGSAALQAQGRRLDPAIVPYRPSEPESLSEAPRAVYQVDLADRDQGYVVIYELPDVGAAGDRGREFGAYLGNGFGQTNYPLDAQFALSQVGGTLLFTWWSPARSSDDDAARRAFEAVAAIGQPIAIVK